CILLYIFIYLFSFFTDSATTEIYTLSLHDALPILEALIIGSYVRGLSDRDIESLAKEAELGHVSKSTVSRICRELRDRYTAFCKDRKSTRLNSSHDQISYAVFCLKKKKTKKYYNNI